MALKFQRQLIKYVLTFFCLACLGTAKAQYVTLPDSNFVTWLGTNGYATCLLGNRLDTTCSIVLHSSSIRCDSANIDDLSGIQYFKALDTLTCSNNGLVFLPALPQSLSYLDFSFNAVTPTFTLPASLNHLNCSQNQMDTLISLPPSLRWLDCSYNTLSALPPLPLSLNELFCEGNEIDSLPDLPVLLSWIDCSVNRIYDLPDLPDSLYEFFCGSNPLLCLPQINTIVNLDFSNTSISCLPDSGNVTNSNPPFNSLPLCSATNPGNCYVPTAVRQIENKTVNLFPNPANSYTVLTTNNSFSKAQVQLLDITGRDIMDLQLTNCTCLIPVSNIQSGLYFVRLNDAEGRSWINKLMIK